jgi:hypothetical protein
MTTPTTTDRIMYDAVDVAAIPQDAGMVAGYVDGGYVTWGELARRFPHARKVSITTTGASVADVIDVESGDATPATSVDWVVRMRALKRRPILYTSSGNLGAVEAQFHARKVAPPFYWIADWTGEPHLYSGSVGTQYASPTVPPPSGPIAYDVSLVSPNWPDPVQKVRPPVNVPLPNWPTIYRLVALVGAALGIIVALGNQLHLPVSVRSTLLAASGGIAWIEHHKMTGPVPPRPPKDQTGG